MGVQQHQTALVVASVLTVGSFVGATAYTQHRLLSLDEVSSTLETNVAPSLDHLSRAGIRLERVRVLLFEGIEGTEASPRLLESAGAELDALAADVERYLQLTPLPGERGIWGFVSRDLAQASRLARDVIDAAERGDRATAPVLLESRANPALDRAAPVSPLCGHERDFCTRCSSA